MVKLVLEENGKRRAFKLGDGILTVGSGAAAKLKLASLDVAEVHLELVLEGGTVTVRPRPGVMPPTLNGVPVTADSVLGVGSALELGGARLWLHVEGAAAPAAAPSGAAGAKRPARQTMRSKAEAAQEQEIRRRRAIEKAQTSGSRSKVERTRPRIERGVPGWLIGGGIVAVAAMAFFLVRAGFSKTAAEGAGTTFGALVAAEEALAHGNLDRALEKLATIPKTRDLSADEKKRIEKIEDEVKERRSLAELDVHNNLGTKYLDKKLKNYEQDHLQGEPPHAKVRLFLKRLAYFEQRWPKHPELDWVERQRRRFGAAVDLSIPPDYEDLFWEVSREVSVTPRNYREALEQIDAYLARSDADRPEDARALREQYLAEREEYHVDRLQQARYEVERKNDYNKSIWWLVHSVIWLGDDAMQDEAAGILVALDKSLDGRLPEFLRGYEDKYPEKYELLMQNRVVREFAQGAGML